MRTSPHVEAGKGNTVAHRGNKETRGIARRGRWYLAVFVALCLVSLQIPALSVFVSDGAFADEAVALAEGAEELDSSSEESRPYVVDVAIYDETTQLPLWYATAGDPPGVQASITERGGSIDLMTVITWNDNSDEPDSYLVSWATSDSSVATVTADGVVRAAGDGTARITATVGGDYTADGSPLVAAVNVAVSGQTDNPYITALRILAPDGTAIGTDVYTWEGTVGTMLATYFVEVDVFDPIAETTATYSSQNGLISVQTGGAIADPTWGSDGAIIAVSTESGNYGQASALSTGNGFLTASTTATVDGSSLTVSANVYVYDPEATYTEDHPQETLRILAYWEEVPPENRDDPDDPAYVIDKEYTPDDIAALGTFTEYYTAITGSGHFYTFLGYGTLLTSVLRNAGIDFSDPDYQGINTMRFGTYDNIDRTVSYDFVVRSDRYYYPNIDLGQYNGAVQVAPMIALESARAYDSVDVTEDMLSDGRRFHLLFGANVSTGNNSYYSIYQIHTIYIELTGGPPVEDPAAEGDPNSGSGGGDGSGNGGGSGDGEGGGGSGEGGGSGTTGEGAGGARGGR